MNKQVMFECNDDDFYVRSKDRAEVEKIGRQHVKEMHNMEISDEDLASHIRGV